MSGSPVGVAWCRARTRSDASLFECHDGWQDVRARVPVVLGGIHFGPWEAPRLDDVQGAALRKYLERPRQPFTRAAGGHQLVDLLDQHAGPGRAEFSNADVFAVGLGRVDCLGDRLDAAAPDA